MLSNSAAAIRFGLTSDEQLSSYQQQHLPQLLGKLQPLEAQEVRDIFHKTQQVQKTGSMPTIILKRPYEPGLLVWNHQGEIPRQTYTGNALTPFGLSLDDMNYLTDFYLQDQQGKPLRLMKRESHMGGATFFYQHNNALLVRHDRLRHNQLTQMFDCFPNKQDEPLTLRVVVGANIKDMFESRGEKIAPDLARRHNLLIDDASNGAVFETTYQKNGDMLHRYQLSLKVNSTLPHKIFPLDDHKAVIEIVVPPHSAASQFSLSLTPVNLQKRPQTVGSPTPVQLHLNGKDSQWSHLPEVFEKASHNLKQLMIPVKQGQQTYWVPAAGLPNFNALFGRDSLVTAQLLLPFKPELARDVLKALAAFQGQKSDVHTEEEPGAILHELRLGEWTDQGLTKHQPYYGTIDATPLYTKLMSDYVRQTQDVKTLDQLWPNYEMALDWIDQTMAASPKALQGFLTQRALALGPASLGLQNIGWKDSGHAVRHLLTPAGKLENPQYPIALAEVQSYVYGAWKGAAQLYADRAARLAKLASPDVQQIKILQEKSRQYQEKATTLKEKFNQHFWLPDKQFVAMALQANGAPLPSIASNGVQALGDELLDHDKVVMLIKRLTDNQPVKDWQHLRSDLLPGTGLRTLSDKEAAFDPLSYQNGAVWPHDTAMAVHALKQSGQDEVAAALASQLLHVSKYFPEKQVPELFAGFKQNGNHMPIIPYPDTCIPQAWSAASVYGVMASLLGIEWQNGQLMLKRPIMPTGIDRLTFTTRNSQGQDLRILVEREGLQIRAVTDDEQAKEIPVLS